MPDQKRRIAKRKTFTGCWTCRESKIRCDCTHPQCLRCLHANKVCKGYDVQLTWIDVESAWQRPSAIKRQAMGIAPNIYARVLHTHEIDSFLEWLEVCDPGSQDGVVLAGPFGVFNPCPPASRERFAEVSKGEFSVSRTAASRVSLGQQCETPNRFTPLSQQRPLQKSLLRSARCISWTSKAMSDGFDQIRTYGSSSVPRPAMQIRRLGLLDQPPAIPSQLTHVNPLAELLLDHYTSYVATLLQPVARSGNAYKSIHAPIAIQAWDALCHSADDPSASVAASDVAILFSILATSAVHLHSPSDRPSQCLFRAFQQQAHSNLSLALKHSSPQSAALIKPYNDGTLHDLENIMSASLTLITLDVGNASNSSRHVIDR